MTLYPALLTDDPEVFAHQLGLVLKDGRLKTIQVDVIDGEFIDNTTLFPSELTEFDFGNLNLDLHLLTEEPQDVVQEVLDLGGQLPVRSIIAQIEHMTSQQFYVDEVKGAGYRVGMSVDFFTPLTAIEPDIWRQLDLVQIMGNEAGFQGAPLHPLAVEKIAQARAFCQSRQLDPEIVVDVGVKTDNFKSLIKAGASSVCAGSALWSAPDFTQVVSEFLS